MSWFKLGQALTNPEACLTLVLTIWKLDEYWPLKVYFYMLLWKGNPIYLNKKMYHTLHNILSPVNTAYCYNLQYAIKHNQTKSYIFDIYAKSDLAFNNKQWLISSSSSSCRPAGTDIPDPLSPLLPIVHRLWEVFRATSRIPA